VVVVVVVCVTVCVCVCVLVVGWLLLPPAPTNRPDLCAAAAGVNGTGRVLDVPTSLTD